MSADHKMADGTERLAKRVAVQQSCSRADAERYIEGGWIAVDGRVVEEPGFRVGASQTVSLLPGARLETLRPVTILVHKPVGVYANDEPGSARDLIVPANRMEGDRSPQRYLKRLLAGLRLVTPLERAASGLVVYTQEYPVARKLQEEARLVEQEYIAEVSGSLDAEGLAWLRRGLPYDGRPASPMQVSWQNETRLRFALKTPAPGFIEYACDAAGLELPAALAPLRIWPRSAERRRSTPDRCRTIPSRQRAEVFQTGRHARAGCADPGGCATGAPSRRARPAARSGHARAGRAVPPLRPGGAWPSSRRVGRAERRGRCRRLAAVARLSTAHHAGRPQPPGHAFRLSGRHGRGAADLHAAFTSADIDAVWCLQGGFGSWRLLDLLDYELLRRHAKPFIGYSDITALHLAIQRHAGFVTFHGPMLAQDLLNGREEPTESALYAMVGGRMGQGAWIGAPDYALPTTLMPGTATGRLAGGNLALICAMQARATRSTRATPSCSSRTSTKPCRASTACCRSWRRRASSNRSRACWRGFTRSGARDDAQFQYAFHPAARALRPAGHSVLAGWPSGHGDPNLTLPLGARVTLDATRQGLRLEQAVTR